MRASTAGKFSTESLNGAQGREILTLFEQVVRQKWDTQSFHCFTRFFGIIVPLKREETKCATRGADRYLGPIISIPGKMFGETEITSFSLTGLTPFAMFWMPPPPVGMNVLRSTAQRLYAAACLVSLTLFGSCRRKRA